MISESTAAELSLPLPSLSKDEDTPSQVLENANPARVTEFSLTPAALRNWVNLAFALQGMAKDYEPGGEVGCMGVFYAVPLKAVAQSKKEWVEGPLSKWRDFVREEPRFHEVEGAHYTMISEEHVRGFARKLRAVLERKGV